MSYDLFISYAREDEEIVNKLLPFFERLKVSVWTDQKIRQSEIYTLRINEVLSTCKCVLMLWSDNAAQSTYVQAESERALQDEKLVIGSMIDLELPVPFNIVQSASLSIFSRNVSGVEDRLVWDDQGFQSVLDGVGVILERGDHLRKWAEAEGHEHPQPQMWEVLAASDDPLAVAAKQRATSTWFELIEMQRREGAFPVLDDLRRKNTKLDADGPQINQETEAVSDDGGRKSGGLLPMLAAAAVGLVAGWLLLPSPFGVVPSGGLPNSGEAATTADAEWVYPTRGPCSDELTAGRIGSASFDLAVDNALQAALKAKENDGSDDALETFVYDWYCAEDKLILRAYLALES